jgi:hypothetical protein
MDTPAHRALADLAPAHEKAELRRMIERIPPNLHEVVFDTIALGTDRMSKLLMGAAAAFYVRESMKANSGVALLPVGIVPGANCTPGIIYPLQPFTSGVTSGPYQFVTNQVFFDLMTGEIDANNGWHFVSNSVKFSNDPLSGMAYGDTSFGNFCEQVVAGREILGEYFHHTVIEQLTFFASAILYNAAPKPMVWGANLRFWDKRCDGDGALVSDYFHVFKGPSFAEVCVDLLKQANGGASIRDLFDGDLGDRLRRSARSFRDR